jgi:hypothetical protein
MVMTTNKMTDDDMMDMIREVFDWKERDIARTEKYNRLMKQYQKRRRMRLTVGISAGILSVMLIIILLPWSKKTSARSPEGLYLEYYKPFQFASDYRDGEPSSNSLYAKAVSAYRDQHWAEAQRLSDSLLIVDSANSDYRLINGLSKQASGEFIGALNQYQVLISKGGSYALQAYWYKALILLKTGKIKECRAELGKLKQADNKPYDSSSQSKATRLLDLLNHIQDV